MATNYIVTAHKASAVTASVSGHFTSASDINLIVARSNVLEIYLVAPEGLKPLKGVEIYGKVEHLKIFTPRNTLQDDNAGCEGAPSFHKQLIFILTNRYQAMILEYDEKHDQIITKAAGNMADKTGRIPEYGCLAVIDPTCTLIGMRLYDGVFKVMELEPSYNSTEQDMTAFNIRLEELIILDITFLHGCSLPTVAILHQDQHGRHIKTYEIEVGSKEFNNGPFAQNNVENEAFMLHAVTMPLGGCLIIGHDSICYYKGDAHTVTIAPPLMKQTTVISIGRVDDQRYLLGDMLGRIHLLLLEKVEVDNVVSCKELKVEMLGDISIPETITYLDNAFVYVGSRFGDSQLIKLSMNPENQSNIEVVDVHPNLGPIVDMVVVDIDKQGQGQLVTCSGAFKDGSIRFIRNGIGIEEQASIEMSGITGMWPMKVDDSQTDNTLVISFVGETRMLKIMGEELEETDLSGFEMMEQTLHCGNVIHGQIIQMTVNAVRIISSTSGGKFAEWKPDGNKRISVVSANSEQALCASGKQLFYLQVGKGELTMIRTVMMEAEISCLDVSPIFGGTTTEICAIGMWDVTARLVKLPDLSVIRTENIGGEILPRNVLLTKLGNTMYLLCAMGDGSLIYFRLNPSSGELENRKKVSLGTKPSLLKPFRSSSDMSVFACGDRPTVIYTSGNDKLVFSNVNLKEVSFVCPLNTEAYPDSLSITDGQTLLFGTIDEIKKLHTRTVSLYESPRRIAHQESSESFGILTMRLDIRGPNGPEPHGKSASITAQHHSNASSKVLNINNASSSHSNVGDDVEVHSLLIMDQPTLTVTHSHTFLPGEFAVSICSTSLGTDPEIYYVVGTALLVPEENEPSQGRIIVFQYTEGRLSQIAEKEVRGATYKIAPMKMSDGLIKLVCAINSSVRIYEWTATRELRPECLYNNTIVALSIDVKGEFILVGDLMKSIAVLAYKPAEGQLEEIARDFDPHWMSACAIIDDDTYIGAENNDNMFTCHKNTTSTSDVDRSVLHEIGQYHLGDFVNVFKMGSLVMHHDIIEASHPVHKPMIYGTVSGCIGVIVQTSPEFFLFLVKLQEQLTKVIRPVGGIQHSEWRSFLLNNRRSGGPQKGFIDGDLIEHFLDLDRETQTIVASQLQLPGASGEPNEELKMATVDDVIKTVEELFRIH